MAVLVDVYNDQTPTKRLWLSDLALLGYDDDASSLLDVAAEYCYLDSACLGFNYYAGTPNVIFKSSSAYSAAPSTDTYFYEKS